MKEPLVSVIISTKNEEKNIGNILESLKKQSCKNIEIIIIDNNSEDKTKDIVESYKGGGKIYLFNHGPERSSQRNFGAKMAKGECFFFLDADMILGERVVEECLNTFSKKKEAVGIIIPEISIGRGFWAKCKALEKSFYIGIDWIEAARFFKKDIFEKAGGYDEDLISGEDWDLSQRVAELGKIERIKEFIYHNEGEISLTKTIKKKFYYSKHLARYIVRGTNEKSIASQLNILARYKLFFSKPKKLFRNPILGLGMLFMKTCEFNFGGLGYIFSKVKK